MAQITFTKFQEPIKVIRRNRSEVPDFLYHYTSETSYWGIVKTGVIFQSENPRAVHHGPGVYLTANPPGDSTEEILSNNYGAAKITAGAKWDKLRYVFQFKPESLTRLSHVKNGERDIWISRSDLRLGDLEFVAYDRGYNGSLKNVVGTNEGCYDPFGGWHTFEPSPGRFRGLRQEDFPTLSGSSDGDLKESVDQGREVGSANHTYGSGRRSNSSELDEWSGEHHSESPHYSWDNFSDRENAVPYSAPLNQPNGFQHGHHHEPSEEHSQRPRRYERGYGGGAGQRSFHPSYSVEEYEHYDRRSSDDYDGILSDFQDLDLAPEHVDEPIQLIRRDSYFLPPDSPPTLSHSNTHFRPPSVENSGLYRPLSHRVPSRMSPPRMPLVQQPLRQRMPRYPNDIRSVRSSRYPY